MGHPGVTSPRRSPCLRSETWASPGCCLMGGLLLLGGGGAGFGDGVEVVGGAVYADEDGVTLAVVVVEVGEGDEAVLLEDEVDGFGGSLGVADGGLELVAGEGLAVDGVDLLAGGELGVVGGAGRADVGDLAFAVHAEAERVPDVDAGTAAAADGGE